MSSRQVAGQFFHEAFLLATFPHFKPLLVLMRRRRLKVYYFNVPHLRERANSLAILSPAIRTVVMNGPVFVRINAPRLGYTADSR